MGRLEIGLDRHRVRLGGIDLRFGLTDVFDARAGFEQPKLRDGSFAIGTTPLDLQLGVARVELCDDIAAVQASAFVDAELENSSTDFRRDVHFSRFDVAGDSQRVIGRVVRARGGDERDDQPETAVLADETHESFRSMPLTEACMWRANSSTGRGSARSLVRRALAMTRCRTKKIRIGGMIVRWVSSGSTSRKTPSR